METYGHYEFEELLKDQENKQCFDCGKKPAQWASVNNVIYLCLTCAGEHRGYGVSISYMRSITIDTWNDNQINMMKNGGNKYLRELLEVYQIDRLKVNKTILYNSKLLDFYRKLIKSKAGGEGITKTPPLKEDALKSFKIDNQGGFGTVESSKITLSASKNKEEVIKMESVSSENNTFTENGEDTGFSSSLNSWMGKAIDSTKYIAGKVGGLELGTTLISTGNVVAETGSNLVDQATEAAKSEKLNSFAKKANDGINFVMNRLFGSKKKVETEKKEDE